MEIKKTEILAEFKSFLDSFPSLDHNNLSPGILSFSFEILSIKIVELLTLNTISSKDNFYWNIADEQIEFLAINPIVEFKKIGENRLANTSLAVAEIEKYFHSNWTKNGIEDAPLVVGGIKFAPDQNSELWQDFSDSDWFIPQALFYRKKDKYFLIYNFKFSNNETNLKEFEEFLNSIQHLETLSLTNKSKNKISDLINNNSYENWELTIKKALERISKGMLSKVVLSREVKIQLEEKPIWGELITQLSKKYPRCYVFMYKRGESVFFGASPEKLAKVANGWIEVDALAGSVPRGKNDIEDVEMEHFLLTSEKNLFEQRAVVNFIHNLLSNISDEIIFDDKPIIRKLPNIQHLWTEIKAKLRENTKMFDVLLTLHPTPAICGDPWKIAMYFILDMEMHDRGLYSGNIGWFNFNGFGEFSVAIRSALNKEKSLYAYAGCGIVQGSEPKSEFEESEIKLKPILSLFVDEKIYQS